MTSRELKRILVNDLHIPCTVRTITSGERVVIEVSCVYDTIDNHMWDMIDTIIEECGLVRGSVVDEPNESHEVVKIAFHPAIWSSLIMRLIGRSPHDTIRSQQSEAIIHRARRIQEDYIIPPFNDIPFPDAFRYDGGIQPQVMSRYEEAVQCSGACGNELNLRNEAVFWGEGNEAYCKNDFQAIFSSCGVCSRGIKKTNMKNCDICTRDICVSCARIHECWKVDDKEKEIRRGMYKKAIEQNMPLQLLDNPMHDFRKDFIAGESIESTRFIKKDRFVGVEIEVEKGKPFGLNVLLPEAIGISHDGSLDKGGIEIQTPPASLEALETIITETCQTLKSRDWKSTVKCGLHIHLDATDFKNNHEKVIHVIKTFYAIEDMIFSILPPSRWVSKYCQRLSKDYLYNSFNSRAKSDVAWYKEENARLLEGRKSRKYDKARYYGINIHSLFYNGTLELRYHSGTVNEKKILYWTAFALNVLDYALNKYDDKIIKKLFDMETSERKFETMGDLFKLPYDMMKYMRMRINKFNPNFNVKFNQGKEAREKEKKVMGKFNKKINDKIAEIKPKILRDVRKMFKDSGEDNPERFRTRDFIQLVEERVDQQLRIAFPNQYPVTQTESGFIKDEEVNTITNYINQGRNLEREEPQDGEREE